jgi:hypothetical protein
MGWGLEIGGKSAKSRKMRDREATYVPFLLLPAPFPVIPSA